MTVRNEPFGICTHHFFTQAVLHPVRQFIYAYAFPELISVITTKFAYRDVLVSGVGAKGGAVYCHYVTGRKCRRLGGESIEAIVSNTHDFLLQTFFNILCIF